MRVSTACELTSPCLHPPPPLPRQCLLQASEFVEFMQLHLDPTGRLQSLEYLVSEGVHCANNVRVGSDRTVLRLLVPRLTTLLAACVRAPSPVGLRVGQGGRVCEQGYDHDGITSGHVR